MTRWINRSERRKNLAAAAEYGVARLASQELYRKVPREELVAPQRDTEGSKDPVAPRPRVRPSERHTVGGVVTAEDIMRGIGVAGE